MVKVKFYTVVVDQVRVMSGENGILVLEAH